MKKIIKRLLIVMFLLIAGALMTGGIKWYPINENIQIGLSKIQDCNMVYWNTTQPIYEDVEKSYICETDYFNYTINPKYAWCWDYLPSNTSYLLIFEHSFLWGNLETKTIYWNETEQIGTDIIKNEKENCIDTKTANVYLNKSDKIFHWVCDYSEWGNCGIDKVNKRLVCDSKKDGNADGICQSGESCLSIDITKEGIRKLKNTQFHTALDKYDIECEII